MRPKLGYFEQHGHTSMDAWLLRRLVQGWHPTAVTAASGGRISLRTAYRWAAELICLEYVTVAGYEAVFAIRRTLPPARVSEWKAVPVPVDLVSGRTLAPIPGGGGSGKMGPAR